MNAGTTMWDDERIDAAINETARQMTAGEPRADFRVRVMGRIGARASGMRAWRPALVAASVAAAILLGVMVLRDHSRPRVIGPPDVRLKPDAAYAPVTPAPPRPNVAQVRLASEPDAKYSIVARGFSSAIADDRPDIEQLTTMPLELESVSVAPLAAGGSIHIEPLAPAAPIAVAPLDMENEGDRR